MFSDLINPTEIKPPELRCKQCGEELAIYEDRKTDKLIRHRRRALMKCTRCGELQVTADPIFERKRHRIARVIAWVGAVLFLFVEIIVEYVRFTEDPLSGPWFILGMMTLTGAVLAGLVCMYTVQVILPGDAKDRLGAAMSGLMMLAVLLGIVWMLYKSPGKFSLRDTPNPPMTPSAP